MKSYCLEVSGMRRIEEGIILVLTIYLNWFDHVRICAEKEKKCKIDGFLKGVWSQSRSGSLCLSSASVFLHVGLQNMAARVFINLNQLITSNIKNTFCWKSEQFSDKTPIFHSLRNGNPDRRSLPVWFIFRTLSYRR